MLTIHVCIGSACHLRGSYNVINMLQSLVEEKNVGDRVTVKAALCLGSCSDAVSVRVNDEDVYQVSEKNLSSFFDRYVMNHLKEE